MFQRVRTGLADHLRGQLAIAQAIHKLSEASDGKPEDPGLAGRVADLERTLEARIAEADASFTKAEGSRQAARNAEERSRGMEKRAAKLAAIVEPEEEEEEEDPFEVAARTYTGNGVDQEDPGAEAMLRPGPGEHDWRRAGLDVAREAKRHMRGAR